MATSAVVRSRELLRWIAATDYDAGVGRSERLSIQSRFTTDPTASIREALLETESDAVLLELPNSNARRQHRLEAILHELSSDSNVNLIVARPDPAAHGKAIAPKSVLVPLRGGPNAWLALGVGMVLASWARARLTLLHVFNPRDHHALLRHDAAIFHQLTATAEALHPEILETFDDDAAGAMLDVSGGHDAVVLGAYADPSRPGLLFGEMLTSVVSSLTQTVILTRAAQDSVYRAA